ncbi:MAG: hypothetical protein AMK72_10670 [Planctomycetes bacterium SM23_25]|nr:MAG: hypothetical protein AMS14_06450 [Planctomycetes bacterium DG_20]KPK45672.1 MAG: hypothetical protein AMK72_10670 [Planctomycetes bacterium SM23_25]
MNALATQVVADNEGTPDAAVTRAALRRATQMAEAASGLALLMTAAAVALTFALLYALGERSASYYVPVWMAVLVAMGLAYWVLFFWIQKRRTRAGLPVVEARRPGPLKIVLLSVGLGLYVVMGAVAAFLVRASSAYHLMLIIPFGVVYGVVWCVHGVQTRQWEDTVLGLVLAVASAGTLLVRDLLPEGWLILFAVCFVVSGLVKHLRWREWVRSVQAEPSAAAPEGGAS